MKTLALIACLFGSAFALAAEDTNITQDTVQSNDAINAPTSIMQNTQVNSGVTHDSFGGGISCARTTIQGGAIGLTGGNDAYNVGTQLYIGFSMPLGGVSCDDAAKGQMSLNHQREMNLRDSNNRNNEMHTEVMLDMRIKYAELLAKTCMTWHRQIVAERDSTMERECRVYSPTKIKHGHTEADDYDSERFNRVSDHSH